MYFSFFSQKDVNPDRRGNKSWLSNHRCLFVILVLAVVLCFNYISKKDFAPEWNPKQSMHSASLFFSFRKLTNRNGSEAKQTAGAPAETQNIWWRNQTSAAVELIQTQTARPVLVPYVSPGPYLVEYPYEYRFTINEPQTCEQEPPFVVLMVQVAPRNRADRDVIRSTWGSESLVLGQDVKLLFLLGMQTGDDAPRVHEQLLSESQEHHDLIQSDFVDSYKNLTIKTMVMLEWLSLYCPNASYAMKIDSDIFLNVENMVKLLLKAPKMNYLTGRVDNSSVVFRDPESKWYVPEDVLPYSIYPPYPYGLGYIFSLDLPKKLIEASRHVKVFYIEDAYLGVCMHHLGLRPTEPPNGDYFNDIPSDYSPCGLSKVIAITTEPTSDRVQLWKDFKEQAKDCEDP